MSRASLHSNQYTNFIGGSDLVLGSFLQITDERFRDSDKDVQGEGYILDWDATFGFSVNEINATLFDIHKGPKHLQSLVESFITKHIRQESL